MRGRLGLAGLALLALALPVAALELDGDMVPEAIRGLPGEVAPPDSAVAPEPAVPSIAPRPRDLPWPDDRALPDPLAGALRETRERVAPSSEVGEHAWTDSPETDAHTQTKDFENQHLAPQAPEPVAGTTAILGGLALAAGLGAWFWPALKVALAPLYSRISKDAVLLHGSRENIYRLVRENPGIHAHEVAERLDLAWGTAIHHLKLLETNGLITSFRDGRYKRFFLVGDQRLGHKEAVAALRNDTARRIVETVAGKPGLIQKDVCEALGVSSSLATWHLQRLAEAGLVLAHRRGRVVHYEPGPAWRALKDLPSV